VSTLSELESRRLVERARAEGRSQAEIIRQAITAYVPTVTGGGDFALAAGSLGAMPTLGRSPRFPRTSFSTFSAPSGCSIAFDLNRPGT
jgi:outer membrane protein TolC